MANLVPDALTGLPGRARFHALLAAASSKPDAAPGLLLLDLDGFPAFVDALGHQAGETLVADVALRLVGEVGTRGTASRLGKSEIALLLPEVAAAELRELAAACLRLVRQPRPGHDLALTASIGTAIAPDDATGAWGLLHCAALARFVAQSSGRNRAVASKPLLHTQVERSVREGIAAGSFSLNYQPIVTLTDPPRIAMLEAFLRWHHPTRGLIFPGDFLPLLEEPRVARLLGGAALAEAVAQARRWIDARVEFGRIGLNLSVHQLREGDLAAEVQAALARRGVPPTALAFDLPHDIYLADDLERIGTMLRPLAASGVAFAADGGTEGNMGIPALQRLPIRAVKLSRGYLETAKPGQLEAVIADGRAAGLLMVAEGVEDAYYRDPLVSLGCDWAQGWGIGRPMPASKIPAFAARLPAAGTRKAA